MVSNRRRCGVDWVLGHPADCLLQSLFELVQGDSLQIDSLTHESINDSLHDIGGSWSADWGLHFDVQRVTMGIFIDGDFGQPRSTGPAK